MALSNSMLCLASPTMTASVSVSGSIALILTCRPFGINSKSISFMDFFYACYSKIQILAQNPLFLHIKKIGLRLEFIERLNPGG